MKENKWNNKKQKTSPTFSQQPNKAQTEKKKKNCEPGKSNARKQNQNKRTHFDETLCEETRK